MGADKSRSYYRGLLLQDPRLRSPDCLWSAQSSYTEANPRPGAPVSTGTSQAVLQASGEQSVSASVTIQGLAAGMPGPGGAGIGWYGAGDLLCRGWDPPLLLSGWEAVTWTDGSGPAVIREVGSPHAVTLSDGTVVAAAQVRHVSGVTTTYRIYVFVRDPSTGSWSSQSVYSQSGAPTLGLWPCLLVLPSGQIQLYYLRELTDECQMAMLYSTDQGATWSTGSLACLNTSMDTSGAPGAGADGGDPWRPRAVYKDGQVLMMVSYRLHDTSLDTAESYYQFASSDLGCSFDAVGTVWNGDAGTDEGGAYHELLVLDGKFQMLFLGVNRSDRPVLRAVANAYERIGSVAVTDLGFAGTWGNLDATTADYYTDGDLAAWVDEDGVAYLAGRMVTDNGEIVIARSNDGGTTWAMLGQSDYAGMGDPVGAVIDFADASTYVKNLCAVRQGGRAILLHNWAANPGDEDNSLGAAYLGGWSTVTMPTLSSVREDVQQVSWSRTWFAIEVPSDCGWTASGAGSATLSSGSLVVSTTAQAKNFSINPTGTIAEGMVVRVALKVTSGGSLASDTVGARLRVADGVNDYDVSLRARLNGSTHEVRVYDNNAGAAVGSDMTVAGTGGVDLLVALGDASLAVWYRARGLGTDRDYAEGPASTSLTTDGATPEANHLIQWGHFLGSTADSAWYEVHYVSDEYAGFSVLDLSEGQENPDDLFARTAGAGVIYIDDGLQVRVVDGPLLAGETFTIAAAPEYAISRIFPETSPSPRVRFRSTSTAQQTIALAFDESLLGTVESALGNSAIGLYLGGINWRTGTLQGYDVDTAAWVTIATIDTSTGMTGLDWTRKGNTVIPATGGAGDQPYLHFNECAGWTLGYNGVTFRRIRASTEGRWDRTSGTTKRPTLFLEEVEGTDPTSGGSAYLMPTEYTCVVYTEATYAGYRLVIDSQTTVDGYFEIGTCVLGPVVLFGSEYSWGRRIETEPGADVTAARDGTDRARPLAPTRRAVELSWVDGVELSGVEGGDPDYVLPTATASATPAASVGDVPYLLDGLVRWLDGARRPVVYLPRLAKGPPDTIHLNRRAQFLYGRTAGTVSVENVLGEELSSELSRIGAIAIREVT